MLQRSPRLKTSLDEAARAEPVRRQFGRLRPSPAGAPPPDAPSRSAANSYVALQPPPPPALQGADSTRPLLVPVDFAKTFVGSHGTYYDERWRWMEWRGRNRSWNWSAALTLGGWLAYRRFYVLAAIHLAWVGLLWELLLHGASWPLTAAAQLVVALVAGLYCNRLYQHRFRRVAWRVAQEHDEHAERLDALARLGGVDPRAVWIMGLAGIGLAALLIGLDD